MEAWRSESVVEYLFFGPHSTKTLVLFNGELKYIIMLSFKLFYQLNFSLYNIGKGYTIYCRYEDYASILHTRQFRLRYSRYKMLKSKYGHIVRLISESDVTDNASMMQLFYPVKRAYLQ